MLLDSESEPASMKKNSSASSLASEVEKSALDAAFRFDKGQPSSANPNNSLLLPLIAATAAAAASQLKNNNNNGSSRITVSNDQHSGTETIENYRSETSTGEENPTKGPSGGPSNNNKLASPPAGSSYQYSNSSIIPAHLQHQLSLTNSEPMQNQCSSLSRNRPDSFNGESSEEDDELGNGQLKHTVSQILTNALSQLVSSTNTAGGQAQPPSLHHSISASSASSSSNINKTVNLLSRKRSLCNALHMQQHQSELGGGGNNSEAMMHNEDLDESNNESEGHFSAIMRENGNSRGYNGAPMTHKQHQMMINQEMSGGAGPHYQEPGGKVYGGPQHYPENPRHLMHSSPFNFVP
jgi:hypothetical protein